MTDDLRHRNDFNRPEEASAFDQTSFWCARFGALLFQHLELRRNISILDRGCGTGFPRPFPDEPFDLITCNLGLNNFADPPATVAECLYLEGQKPGYSQENCYARLLSRTG